MTYTHAEKTIDLYDIEGSLPMFKRFIELVPDGVIGVRANGEIAFANSQAETLFGYRPNELLAMNVEQLVPEHFRRVHATHRDGYFSHPRTRPMNAGLDLFGRRADGSEFPADISLSVVRSATGMIALAVIREIPARVEHIDVRSDADDQVTQLEQALIGRDTPAVRPHPGTEILAEMLSDILSRSKELASKLSDRTDPDEMRRELDNLQRTAFHANELAGRQTSEPKTRYRGSNREER